MFCTTSLLRFIDFYFARFLYFSLCYFILSLVISSSRHLHSEQCSLRERKKSCVVVRFVKRRLDFGEVQVAEPRPVQEGWAAMKKPRIIDIERYADRYHRNGVLCGMMESDVSRFSVLLAVEVVTRRCPCRCCCRTVESRWVQNVLVLGAFFMVGMVLK